MSRGPSGATSNILGWEVIHLWTKAFWKDAIERAVKTAAQAALASIGAVSWANGGVTWGSTLVGLGIGVGLSFVTSVLSSLVGSSSSASALPAAGEPPPRV